MSAPESSLYDRVGGQAYFVALVDRFHEHVERDPVLRPTWGRARRTWPGSGPSYWGGPPDCSARRGGPDDAEALVEYVAGAAAMLVNRTA
jgi:hemoglobin